MKLPSVTILILDYNGLTDTVKCIKSLLKTRYPAFKIIVGDNGSTKNEARMLSQLFPEKILKCYRFGKNYGFSGGHNRLLKKVKDKYVVLMNNDIEVVPSWLMPLVNLMEKDSRIAVVQPKIRWLKQKEFFDYAGAAGGFIDCLGYPFTRGRIFNSLEKDHGQYDTVADIFWASGATMIIRNKIIREVGNFDERFFNYMEEIDLCHRIHQKKYRIVCQPQSIVYHQVGSTASRHNLKKRYWEHRNNLLLLLKNYPVIHLFYLLPFRIILEWLSFFYYLYLKKVDFALAVVLAQISFFYNFPGLVWDRLKNNSGKPNRINRYLMYPSSIVFSYFVRKKRFYSQIVNTKKVITFIIANTKTNGGNRVVFDHIKYLHQAGHQIRLISIFGQQPKWFALPVKVESIFSLIKSFNSEMVVATFWPTAYLAAIIPAAQKLYLIQGWEEEFYHHPLLRMLVRFTYSFPFQKIVFSDFIKNKLHKYNRTNNHTLKTNGLIINPVFFNNRKKNSVIGKIVNIISVVSNYQRPKGIDQLIKTVKELKTRYPHYCFTLVSYEKTVYSSVFDRFVSGANPKKLAALYRKADVLLSTSRQEGFFLPGLEAMASGCPVITTDSGGIKEYIKNNFNAIILNNIEQVWKQPVIERLINDRLFRRRLIANGLETAKKYSVPLFHRELNKIYFHEYEN